MAHRPSGPSLPPPTTKTKNPSYAIWAKQHGLQPGVAADIQYWAKVYHMNPYYFASVILAESNGQHMVNGQLHSSGQAGGIGQISYGHIGTQQPWGDHHRITMNDIRDYNWNLRYSAYLLSQAVTNYGYQGAYLRGYNPSDPNKGKAWQRILSMLPGKTLPGGAPSPPGGTPTEATGPNTATAQQQAIRSHYDPIYLAYAARRMSQKEVNQMAARPMSDFELESRLMNPKNNPRFFKSPVWQSRSKEYFSTWQGIFGPNAQMDPTAKHAISQAILRNWSSTAFQTYIRNQPFYNQSEEFKGLFSQYSGQYQQIYGKPTEQANGAIRMAVKKGWNSDQWTSYLRAQPEWKSSAEYKKMAEGLVNAMGMLPQAGGQTVLQPGQSTPVALGK